MIYSYPKVTQLCVILFSYTSTFKSDPLIGQITLLAYLASKISTASQTKTILNFVKSNKEISIFHTNNRVIPYAEPQTV